jgi:hypothetical protein
LDYYLIDKRNFYFLVDFANKLTDYVGVIDEKFYLRLQKEFIDTLNHVFFKIDKGIIPEMYNKESYVNKDTLLLHKIFKKYNQAMSFSEWRDAKTFRRALKRFYIDKMEDGEKYPEFHTSAQREFYAGMEYNNAFVTKDFSNISILDKSYYVLDNEKNRDGFESDVRTFISNFDINEGPYLYRMSENLFYNFLEEDEELYKEVHDNMKKEDFIIQPKDTWMLSRINLSKSKRSFLVKNHYERLYDSNLLKFIRDYKAL